MKRIRGRKEKKEMLWKFPREKSKLLRKFEEQKKAENNFYQCNEYNIYHSIGNPLEWKSYNDQYGGLTITIQYLRMPVDDSCCCCCSQMRVNTNILNFNLNIIFFFCLRLVITRHCRAFAFVLFVPL